ncbi:hypothetical protein FRC14_003748 [Serendipita sp. 396]|nr:hypothetical protein FRC14_003748 [Serendipita sp. 396]KAG8873960.1 hypothetical protein FRC20_007069 [Serendipita sp. 405]KAG9024646.1 hypothetical protein FS842_005438 [Serendipita sp. 407]
MADLLPDELLVQIFEELIGGASWQQSLVSLCRTSRRFYRASLPCLYRSVQLNGSTDITLFLNTVLTNVHLRQLVKNFSIWLLADATTKRDDPNSRITVDLKELKNIVETCISTPTWANRVFEFLNRGSVLARVLLTIMMLPELESLELETPLGDKILDDGLVALALVQGLPQKLKTLQRSAGLKYDYRLLRSFFSIPSLKKITCFGAESSPSDHPSKGYRRSKVEVLHLLSSRVSGDDLSSLLRSSPCLKELVYLDRTEGKKASRLRFTPFDEALSSVAGTLESLSLIWYDTNEDATHQGFLSIRNFRRLQKLTIQFELLLGRTPGQIPLTEALPTSIRYLELRKSDAWWHGSGDGRPNPWTDSLCIDAVQGLLFTEEGEKFIHLEGIILRVRKSIDSLIPLAQNRSLWIENKGSLSY